MTAQPKAITLAYVGWVLLVASTAGAQEREAEESGVDVEANDDSEHEADEDMFMLPELEVAYRQEDIFRLGGSAQLIDEEQLEAFEYDDPNSILLQTPGLYVRQEDGFGLRPNIGLRGGNSDRSKRVTLMEDGVLFAPAPYAAPAAYYFPLMSRITGVEVFKGPSAILYGPNTIGGAVNFLSRDIPAEPSGEIDVSFGRFWSRRLHAHYGARNEWGGFLIEAADLGSTGFKELDFGDPDTGFHRSEFNLRGQLNTDPDAAIYHQVQLRLGYSRERSNETYLGLTDADFAENPDRRYAASQADRMTWWRTQAQIRYDLSLGDHAQVTTVLYRHDFDRTWTRLNRFRDGPGLLETLANPTGRRDLFYRVLTGQSDSASVSDPFQDGQDLLVVDNARRFVSQGIQSTARLDFDTGVLHHDIELGARFHHDQIDRDHAEQGYRMQNQQLVLDGRDRQPITDNEGRAIAFAAYLAYGLRFFDLTVTPGLRMEVIRTNFVDDLAGTSIGSTETVFLPGLGLHYALTDQFGVLAGVHRGFSPVSPGQPDEVEPELSTNYEVGLRYSDPDEQALGEVIGFFSDYSNLTGECSGSTGCSPDLLDRQFNGGEVQVIGLEMAGTYSFVLSQAWRLPVRATYTFTRGTFRTDFESDNPQFGSVLRGDELPYVPTHQARFQAGLSHERWNFNASLTYVGEMREEAGQGDPEPGDLPMTDDYVMVDALASYRLFDPIEVYLRFENILNQRGIVARRPFGARPTRPFQVFVGMRATL